MTEESKKKHLKEDKPLEKMTVKDLKEIALEIPHDHVSIAVSDMKKEELIAFIKEARGIKDEEPHHHEKKKVKVKTTLSKQEIKKKIILLKEAKKAARQSKDRKKVNLLRRNISRLKKKTRKIA